MLYHEYGHVIQSRYFGLSYLFSVGIPSAIVAGEDNGYWTEVMANRFSRDYFGQDVWDQTAGNLFDRETGNPIYPTTYSQRNEYSYYFILYATCVLRRINGLWLGAMF